MPRKSIHYRDQGRERTDCIVNSWRENDYPERYVSDKYNFDEDYVKNQKSSKNKHRRRSTEKDYEEYSREEEIGRRNFSGQNQWIEECSPNDFETYAYEAKTQTYVRSPRGSDDLRKREHQREDRYQKPIYRKYEIDNPNKEHHVVILFQLLFFSLFFRMYSKFSKKYLFYKYYISA